MKTQGRFPELRRISAPRSVLFNSALRALGVASFALALSACTNNFSSTRPGGFSRTGLSGTVGGSDPNSEEGGLVAISRIVRSNTDKNAVFDIVGDGSGTMGLYCVDSTSSGSSSSSTGASTCACQYEYTTSDGASHKFETPTTYHESDLLRCRFDAIPTGVSTVTVKIHVTNIDAYSNGVDFRFTGAFDTVDVSSSSSFWPVKRYQCRDIVYIPHVLDGANGSNAMYDPVQSESTDISYPINFYSTNMGGAISAYTAAGISGWDCPAIPNDAAAGLDLTLFSVSSDGSSKRIYPATGSTFDRSTFQLARSPAGAFSVPVNAQVAPSVTSSQNSPTAPSIGYGARPIPNSSGGESCPTTATIPSGYHWVKVWLFRATLPPRFAATSTLFQQMGAVACNPGPWPQAGGAGPFGSCNSGGGLNGVTTATQLARRVLLSNQQCVSPVDPTNTTSMGGGTTQNTSPLTQQPGYASLASGNDFWRPITTTGSDLSCAASMNDAGLFQLCTTGNAPVDRNPGLLSIDPGNVSRFDFVFVVTPTTVMLSDMKNATNTSLAYTPYRFVPTSACTSPDPDNPNVITLPDGTTKLDCPSNARVNYQLRLTDITVNPDSPADDPSRLPSFPICALQKDP